MTFIVTKKIISRNFTPGRQNLGSPFVVIHTYNGVGTSLYSWFNSEQAQVSAHFAVMHDGTIEQYVELNDTAWHSGNSWANTQSVGIEHQDNGKSEYTDIQMQATAWLIKNIINPYFNGVIAYNEAGITKHSKWSSTGCPKDLPIDKIISYLNNDMNEIKAVSANKDKDLGDVLRIAGISDPGSAEQKQNVANLNKAWLDKNGIIKDHNGTWQDMQSKLRIGDIVKVRGNPSDPIPSNNLQKDLDKANKKIADQEEIIKQQLDTIQEQKEAYYALEKSNDILKAELATLKLELKGFQASVWYFIYKLLHR